MAVVVVIVIVVMVMVVVVVGRGGVVVADQAAEKCERHHVERRRRRNPELGEPLGGAPHVGRVVGEHLCGDGLTHRDLERVAHALTFDGGPDEGVPLVVTGQIGRSALDRSAPDPLRSCCSVRDHACTVASGGYPHVRFVGERHSGRGRRSLRCEA